MNQLRELRQKRGLTQEQTVAPIPGLSQQRLAEYETGKRSLENATFGTVLALCNRLRVSNPRKLLDAAEKPSDSAGE